MKQKKLSLDHFDPNAVVSKMLNFTTIPVSSAPDLQHVTTIIKYISRFARGMRREKLNVHGRCE